MCDELAEAGQGKSPNIRKVLKGVWSILAAAQNIPETVVPYVKGRAVAWTDCVGDKVGQDCSIRVRGFPIRGGTKPTRETVIEMLKNNGVPGDRVESRYPSLVSEAGGVAAFQPVFEETSRLARWRILKDVATKAGMRMVPQAEGRRVRSNPPAGRDGDSSSSEARWDKGKSKVIDVLTSATLTSPVVWLDELDQLIFLQQLRPTEFEETMIRMLWLFAQT